MTRPTYEMVRPRGAVPVALPGGPLDQPIRADYLALHPQWTRTAFWICYIGLFWLISLVVPLMFVLMVVMGRRVSRWIRTLRPRSSVITDATGIQLLQGTKLAWHVRWSDLQCFGTDPVSSNIALLSHNGSKFELPFRLGHGSPFRPERNSLYLRLVEHLPQSGYARAAEARIRKENQVYVADFRGYWFFVLVLSIYAVAASSLYFSSHTETLSYLAWAAAFLVFLGLLASAPNRDRAIDSEEEQWKSLGPTDSLYRQLNRIEPMAYGVYQYLKDFKDIEDGTSELIQDFNITWRRQPPVFFQKIREVYWSPAGISFTAEGEICTVNVEEVPGDLRVGKVLIYVTDSGGTAVFDPRYLRLDALPAEPAPQALQNLSLLREKKKSRN